MKDLHYILFVLISGLIIFFSLTLQAEEPPQGQLRYIIEQQPAFYDGFLADSQQMKYFRYINEERKLLKDKVLVLEDLNLANQKRGDEFQKKFQDSQDQLEWQRVKTYVYTGGAFVGGIGLTLGIIYFLKK